MQPTSIRAFYRLATVFASAIHLACGFLVATIGLWATLENGRLVRALAKGLSTTTSEGTSSGLVAGDDAIGVNHLAFTSYTILAIGCAIVAVALVGFCGTFCNTRRLLIVVSFVQLLAVIFLLVLLCFYLTSFQQAKLEAKLDGFRNTFDSKNHASFPVSPHGPLTVLLEQFTLNRCCGWDSAKPAKEKLAAEASYRPEDFCSESCKAGFVRLLMKTKVAFASSIIAIAIMMVNIAASLYVGLSFDGSDYHWT